MAMRVFFRMRTWIIGGALVLIAGLAWGQASSVQAQKMATLSNLKQVGLATLLYATDFDDRFPTGKSTEHVEKVIWPYVKNREVFKSLNPNRSKLLFNLNLAGVASVMLHEPALDACWYDQKVWPDGTHLGQFADGHAKSLDAQQWKAFSKSLKKKYPKKG